MGFIDLFSGHSAEYASARPEYPDSLFKWIASESPALDRVWDCGTGTGQAARSLAKYFAEVRATDPSPQQIASANHVERVIFSVQSAEKTDFPDHFFDAVCVAQALHWFDHPAFFAEASRVLKPGGLFVAWGYDWFTLEPEFDDVFKKEIRDIIEPYWAPQSKILWDGYKSLETPFKPILTPEFIIELDWSFEQLVAYTLTWSASQKFIHQHRIDPLTKSFLKLECQWPPHTEKLKFSMPLHIIAAKRI